MSEELYRFVSDISEAALLNIIPQRTQLEANDIKVLRRSSGACDGNKPVTMLTISAHTFRIILTLHQADVEEGLQAVKSTEDDLAELMNIYVGDIKRQMQKRVPGLGMSTPNTLNISAMAWIAKTKVDHTQEFVITFDNKPLFHASLYFALYGQVTLNSIDESSESDVGELEFF